MSNSIIEIKNLSKRYAIGKRASYGSLREEVMEAVTSPFRKKSAVVDSDNTVWALRDVSFSVEEGEVLGIIGRNGAGKSTLLKILSRITEPTEGRVVMRGRVASLLEVGTGFHPELTGRENIFLNGALLGMTSSEIRRKFDEIVAFSEIEKFLDTPVKRYSSGMYVRLAFAVAAHLEPEILVIDEVLAVGDASFQKKCLGKMGEVAKGGRTVLFVSHNMGAVKQLCTRVCLLKAGALAFDGIPAEAIATYMQTEGEREISGKPYEHIRGDGRAFITKVYLGDGKSLRSEFSVYDAMEISMDYTLKEPVKELEFFALIYSMEGDVIASFFQRDSGRNTVPSSNEGTVTLKFRNHLSPGKYLVSAGIFDMKRSFIDWVEHVESFYVLRNFADGRVFDNRLGRVCLQGEWSA